MKKILFAKFSRERSRMFQISTVLEEDETGRHAVKSALHDKAVPHVMALVSNEQKLKAIYKDSRLKVCPCSLHGERSVVFPFVEGHTLALMLSRHIEAGAEDEIIRDVQTFYDLLVNVDQLKDFEETTAFRLMFGDVKLPAGMKAGPLSNLDMVLSNLIWDGQDSYTIVDYEWVFDFPIPISYIFARSLMLHSGFQTLPEETRRMLYGIGGVKMEDIPIYMQLEKAFQRYVAGKGELHVLSKVYPALKTKSFPLDHWDTSHVYFPVRLYGVERESGRERELFYLNHFQMEIREQIKIPDTEGYSHLILRPLDTEGVIKLLGITDQKGETLSFTSNAQIISGDDYFFDQEPELRIENNGITCLNLELRIWHRNDSLINQVIGLRLQNETLNQELTKYVERYQNSLRHKVGTLLHKK